MEDIEYLEKECEKSCDLLRSMAFLERVAYASSSQLYDITVAVRIQTIDNFYETYRNMLNFVKAIRKTKVGDYTKENVDNK